MKKILQELRQYVLINFHGGLYLSVAIFAAICLYINYTYDLEDGIIDKLPPLQRFGGMFLFHALPYLLVCLLVSVFVGNREWFRLPGFWTRVFLGFGILAFDRSWSIYPLMAEYFSGVDLYYMLRVIGKMKSLVSMVLPLALLSLWIERDPDAKFYGLKTTYFDPKPYLALLGVAAIAIVIGGFFKDIQEFYPRYLEVNGPRFAEANNIPSWLNVLIYELAYGSDFISVEMFFRGFLIVGMMRYFGPHVVLPMIVTYCFLHFGKPLTESISSLFGGYILGVISLNSKSIWGGIMIHVGLAWLMEIVGYLFRIW